jgi:SAM-dependent methyltransferase
MMNFSNSYEDAKRADSYAKLEFPGTYYLAYRDLPEIIAKHVSGNVALDFGCGTGRSTRFLQKLGLATIGIDISEAMIEKAGQLDPGGDYREIEDGNFESLETGRFDLVLSVFTFDNIPSMDRRTNLFQRLGNLLAPQGRVVCVDSTPELYVNEWASFSTDSFPENRTAKSGDTVRTIMKDVEDRRPVEDVFWTHADYQNTFAHAGLELIATYHPLAKLDEPFAWVSETEIAPWVIYVVKRKD